MTDDQQNAAIVASESAGARLDVFVAQQFGRSRREAKELVHAGLVRLNRRRGRASDLVCAGDRVELFESTVGEVAPHPGGEVRVIYQDDSMIAVDKPVGVPSVALRRSEHDTVANFLIERFPETATAGRSDLEGGLVHRLDNATSGVLLAARSTAAYAALRRQFDERTVRKEYLAVVSGRLLRPRVVNDPIAHAGAKMRVCASDEEASKRRAREACSEILAVEPGIDTTTVRVRIPTGVRHQIRAHLASIGHPVVGDELYGGPSAQRLALHAWRIWVVSPALRKEILVEARSPFANRAVTSGDTSGPSV